MLSTRPPQAADAVPLAALLNQIIAAGGSSAYEQPFSPAAFATTFLSGPTVLYAVVVLDQSGRPCGFQSLSRHPDLPEGWADIATFTRRDEPVPGAGRALFEATRPAAKAAGLQAINATIRADNGPGIRYYRNLGFQPYATSPAVPLTDGREVDRLHHRMLLV